MFCFWDHLFLAMQNSCSFSILLPMETKLASVLALLTVLEAPAEFILQHSPLICFRLFLDWPWIHFRLAMLQFPSKIWVFINPRTPHPPLPPLFPSDLSSCLPRLLPITPADPSEKPHFCSTVWHSPGTEAAWLVNLNYQIFWPSAMHLAVQILRKYTIRHFLPLARWQICRLLKTHNPKVYSL